MAQSFPIGSPELTAHLMQGPAFQAPAYLGPPVTPGQPAFLGPPVHGVPPAGGPGYLGPPVHPGPVHGGAGQIFHAGDVSGFGPGHPDLGYGNQLDQFHGHRLMLLQLLLGLKPPSQSPV